MNIKRNRLTSTSIVFLSFCVLLMSSCATSKKYMATIPYFKDFSDSEKVKQIIMDQAPVLKIQPDDILNITLQTTDPLAASSQSMVMPPNAAQYPIGGGQTIGTSGTSAVTGYLIDKSGYTDLPLIGKIKLAGLTTEEATRLLQEKSTLFYKNATAVVRFANLKVGVLGEVNKPGYYILPNEKNTILDALLYAGDLTIFGKRTNMILLRDSANIKTLYRIDLNNTAMLSQPYFYLRQNDILYIEPTKSKVDSNLNSPLYTKIGLLISALTLVILAWTQIKD